MLIARIALDVPLRRLFDYLCPPELAADLLPGQAVRVPFQNRQLVGILVRLQTTSTIAPERLKPLGELIQSEPVLNAVDLALLEWSAIYYLYPLGQALATALPAWVCRGQPLPEPEPRCWWRLSDTGAAALRTRQARGARQRELLEWLADAPQEQSAVRQRWPQSVAMLATLHQRDWIEPAPPPTLSALTPENPPLVLTHAQQQAVQTVTGTWGRFAPHVLFGVTGSGKTEVFLRLIVQVLAQQGQVLWLAPEIALTTQLAARCQARLGATLVTLHSAINDRGRARIWNRARRGETLVILGTRSAVFTPLPRLALVIVDEEHDLSYKQQEGWRYHARDLAIKKAQLQRCPVVLASATPALESLRNAGLQRYQSISLPERIGRHGMPVLRLIATQGKQLYAGMTPEVIQALRSTLSTGDQALLFLNRRGYAPVVLCLNCGWMADCPHCDAHLVLHRAASALVCHHCGFRQRPLLRCPSCGGPAPGTVGVGTEQLQEALSHLFPAVALTRIDRDVIGSHKQLQMLLEGIRSGRYPLVIGTQMLAKGHDFPQLTLAVVLDADQGLLSTDFRAPERLAQLLLQVAGRAGRAERPGQVLIQTAQPDHPLLLALLREGYAAFASAALRRREMHGLPPFGHQVLLRAESASPQQSLIFLDQLKQRVSANVPSDVRILGPVPSPMERLEGQYRALLLLESPRRGLLQHWLTNWLPELETLGPGPGLRWSIDVDPQEIR